MSLSKPKTVLNRNFESFAFIKHINRFANRACRLSLMCRTMQCIYTRKEACFVRIVHHPDQSGLTFFDPQLSNPWQTNQNGTLVTNVNFVSLFISVIPIRFVDSRSKSIYHPSPES